ncbi:MAG: lipoate--protein ligase [Clostridia bacterium]|nr:lipoate--protein ligase [Clostridia bacterium]
MRAILNGSHDPYFNLASDEFLIDSFSGDVFMLWRNSPSVIIGKNQNAWAEVNLPYTEQNEIPVVRRITGGGAVFHDLGNVNFSFVTEASDGAKLNFARFCDPIIKALSKVGIDAHLDGRNDLVADGFKISGNAECVKRSRSGKECVLHHGTLLFGADISRLALSLKVNAEKIESKGIKSVASRVKNIKDFESYRGPEDVEAFIELIMNEVTPGGCADFSEEEKREIDKLRSDKFSTWKWNFGSSPSFDIQKTKRFPYGTVTVSLTCREGAVESALFHGDFFGSVDTSELSIHLSGVKYEKNSVFALLEENAELLDACIAGSKPAEIAELITG